jgi:hypothetical protein
MNKQNFIYDLNPKEFRKNVLMMGDIIEDTKMVRAQNHENVLRIGYLNDMSKNSHLLQHYMEAFDLVITGDGTLHLTNYLMQRMFK